MGRKLLLIGALLIPLLGGSTYVLAEATTIEPSPTPTIAPTIAPTFMPTAVPTRIPTSAPMPTIRIIEPTPTYAPIPQPTSTPEPPKEEPKGEIHVEAKPCEGDKCVHVETAGRSQNGKSVQVTL